MQAAKPAPPATIRAAMVVVLLRLPTSLFSKMRREGFAALFVGQKDLFSIFRALFVAWKNFFSMPFANNFCIFANYALSSLEYSLFNTKVINFVDSHKSIPSCSRPLRRGRVLGALSYHHQAYASKLVIDGAGGVAALALLIWRQQSFTSPISSVANHSSPPARRHGAHQLAVLGERRHRFLGWRAAPVLRCHERQLFRTGARRRGGNRRPCRAPLPYGCA